MRFKHFVYINRHSQNIIIASSDSTRLRILSNKHRKKTTHYISCYPHTYFIEIIENFQLIAL